jgi:hypothetical protein
LGAEAFTINRVVVEVSSLALTQDEYFATSVLFAAAAALLDR